MKAEKSQSDFRPPKSCCHFRKMAPRDKIRKEATQTKTESRNQPIYGNGGSSFPTTFSQTAFFFFFYLIVFADSVTSSAV